MIIEGLLPLDKAKNADVYKQMVEHHNGFDGWDWKLQQRNFLELAAVAKIAGSQLKGSRCIDVGSGTGEMSAFLRKRDISGYIGIELLDTSITQAKSKFPQEEFIHGDFLSNPFSEEFDFAFASGALTVEYESHNWDVVESMLTKMWRLSRVGLAFNYITDEVPDHETYPCLYVYSASQMGELCGDIASGGLVQTNRSSYDWQAHVYMYRPHVK